MPNLVPRGKFESPHREFEPVLPPLAETLTRLSSLPKLVAVGAPPGYGKTVLLSLLRERQAGWGHRTAWITLDDRDRSVGAVVALLQTALALADVEAASPELEQIYAAHDGSEQRLFARLAGWTEPIILVIDNLHFCTDRGIGALLEQLVFTTPEAVRLVVSSTSALPMDLVRAKLELGALAIGADELCFDGQCVERLFSLAGKPLANAQMAQRIVARTEGWPAAVRLLQVLSATGATVEELIERFTGDHSDIASVLTRRVLAGFDPMLVQFLCEIALLREFSAELACEVTGEHKAPEWTAMLLERNLLVFPLDSGRRWLRMHTLLRQYLLAEGRVRILPERRRSILERAASWHADQGDDATAIDLALDAPNYALASKWLQRSSLTLVGRLGQLPRFMTWVRQLMSAGAPLALDTHAWYIWALCFSLRYEDAQRSIEAFDARLATLTPDEATAFRKRLGLLRVVVSVHVDNMERVRIEAGQWLASGSDHDALGVATVATGAALGAMAAHDFPGARSFMDRAAGAISRSESLYGRAWVVSVRACIEIAQGQPAEADRLIAEVRPSIVAGLGTDAGVIGTLDFVHARALGDLGRRADAQAAASRGLIRAAQHGVIETARHGLAACLSFWEGEPGSPWAPSALAHVARGHGPRLGTLFDALVVRRLIELGRIDEAEFVAERLPAASDAGGQRAGKDAEASELALSRIALALATGRRRDALGWLDACLSSAQSHSMRRKLVELHLLGAAAHARQGEERTAVRHLSLAIVHAAHRQLVGPFRDQIQAVRWILESTPNKVFGFTQRDEQALLARLRQWTDSDDGSGGAAAAAIAPLQALTPREVQFLEMLAQGLNNQQMADRMGLTVPTVKWHLTNLYGKLSVKNRLAALAAARTLGVVPR